MISRRTLGVGLVILTAYLAASTGGTSRRQEIEVALLAHHWPTAAFGLTHVGLRSLFIARVLGGDIATGQLVLLEYFHNKDDPPQIEELMSWSGRWRLTVTRRPECDENTSRFLHIGARRAETGAELESRPALTLLPAGASSEIPKDLSLDCFRFSPGDFVKLE
jgi:hypothetical protein